MGGLDIRANRWTIERDWAITVVNALGLRNGFRPQPMIAAVV